MYVIMSNPSKSGEVVTLYEELNELNSSLVPLIA